MTRKLIKLQPLFLAFVWDSHKVSNKWNRCCSEPFSRKIIMDFCAVWAQFYQCHEQKVSNEVNSPQVFLQLWCAHFLFKHAKNFAVVELLSLISTIPRASFVVTIGLILFYEIPEQEASRGWNQTDEYNDKNDLSLFKTWRSFKWNIRRNRRRKAQLWASQLHSRKSARSIRLGNFTKRSTDACTYNIACQKRKTRSIIWERWTSKENEYQKILSVCKTKIIIIMTWLVW